MRRLRALAVVGALLGAACGVGSEPHPVAVDDAKVPFGLLSSSTTTTTPATPAPGTGSATMCFRQGRAVVPVVRSAPDQGVDGVLRQFLQGPTAEERARGLTSAVFDPSVAAAVDAAGGVATVELSPSFAEASAGTQLDVIVEMVCTLTAQPGVGQVAFELRGERVEVPRGDGSLTAQPVSRDDYRGAIR